jgi:hypothetical protein
MLARLFGIGRQPTAEREPPRSPTLLTLSKAPGSSSAMLAAIFPGVPMTAVVVTVVAYETGFPGGIFGASIPMSAVLTGSGIALLSWILGAIVLRRFASPDLSNVDEFGQLVIRLQQLKEHLAQSAPADSAAVVALQEAKDLYAMVRDDLCQAGLRWVLAIGYVNAWIAVHRAEEALFSVDPVETVVANALYDQLRLEGSDVAHADELLIGLRHAVRVLDPTAEPLYLRVPDAVAPPSDTAFSIATPDAARAALGKFRRTINEYRDLLWAGLARARNQLVATVFVTGLGAYLLLILLMLRGLNPATVGAAAVFFSFGAIVGLLTRLHGESQVDKAVEDFGLSITRLIAAPLLAGLAAVFGVLLVGLAHISIGNVTLGPPAASGSSFPQLQNIFSLVTNPIGFLAAALFGLTPSLLFDYLQSETDAFRKGLKTSEASGQTKPR